MILIKFMKSDNFNIDKYLNTIGELKNIIEERIKHITIKFYFDNRDDFIDLVKFNIVKEKPHITRKEVTEYINNKLNEIFGKSFLGKSYYFKYLEWIYNHHRLPILSYRKFLYTKDNKYFCGNHIYFRGIYEYKKFELHIDHDFYYNKDKDLVTVGISCDMYTEKEKFDINSRFHEIFDLN